MNNPASMRDVCLLGVGMIESGRYPDSDVPRLGVRQVEAARVGLTHVIGLSSARTIHVPIA